MGNHQKSAVMTASEKADRHYETFDFGSEVSDASGWESSSDSKVMTRRVFLEPEGGFVDSFPVTLTVVFDSPAKSSIVEVYCIDSKGQQVGSPTLKCDTPEDDQKAAESVSKTPEILFCQDGGTYGLASGYGYWSVFINGARRDFGGALETPKQRKSYVKTYFGATTPYVEKSREQLLELMLHQKSATAVHAALA